MKLRINLFDSPGATLPEGGNLRTFLLFAGIASAFPFNGFAASILPCGMNTLASYISLSTGCTVGDQLFFGFASLPPTAGTTSNLSATSINITPITTGAPGLLFTLNASAGIGQLVDAAIGFDVTPAMGSMNVLAGSMLTQNGGTATNDGDVVGTEIICLDRAITSTGACTGSLAARNLGTFALAGGLTQTTDSLKFIPPHALLGINANFSAGGGIAGTASVTSFAVQFNTTPTPEPAAFTGCAFGLIGLCFVRRFIRPSAEPMRSIQ